MSDEILLKVMSSSIVGIVSSVIVVKDDGVHLTFEGAATLFANNNLHIPFENISSINTQKKMLGLVYTLVITEISGKTHEVQDLKKDDALNASKFILEMKAYTKEIQQANNNSNSIDFTQQLLNLAKLKDAGVLSQEEFENQKKIILEKK